MTATICRDDLMRFGRFFRRACDRCATGGPVEGFASYSELQNDKPLFEKNRIRFVLFTLRDM